MYLFTRFAVQSVQGPCSNVEDVYHTSGVVCLRYSGPYQSIFDQYGISMRIESLDLEVVAGCLATAKRVDALSFELAISIAGTLQIYFAVMPKMQALFENIRTAQNMPPLLGYLRYMSASSCIVYLDTLRCTYALKTVWNRRVEVGKDLGDQFDRKFPDDVKLERTSRDHGLKCTPFVWRQFFGEGFNCFFPGVIGLQALERRSHRLHDHERAVMSSSG